MSSHTVFRGLAATSAVVLVAVLTVTAVAQQAPLPGVQTTAPDNAPDWASVLAAETDPRISVEASCPAVDQPSPPLQDCVTVNDGTQSVGPSPADVSDVSYGDIAGDGGTEAVIPLYVNGATAYTGQYEGFLLYRLGDPAPQLVDAESKIAIPYIDAANGTLVTLQVSHGVPLSTIASVERTSYRLVSGDLVQQSDCTYVPSPQQDFRVPQGTCASADGSPSASTPSPTAQPAAPGPTSVVAGSVPANTADISSVRSAIPGGQSGFTGQVLVPPAGVQPFASLQLFSASPGLVRNPLSTDTYQVYPQSYTLGFANMIELSQFGVAATKALVAGAISRQMYDDTAADFLKTFPSCAPTAAYCGRPIFPPCTQPGCTLQAEIFHGLKVKGTDALVRHWRVDNAGWGWDVTWFDSQAGVTYRMSTDNGADPGNFDTGLSAKNQAGAQQLVAVAEKLVPWTGT